MNRRTLLGVGIGSMVAAAPTAFVATLLVGRSDGLPAGASVGGVDVGGLSPQEALERVQAAWRPFLDSPVVFRLDGRSWRPSGTDIGLQADFQTPLREIVVSRATGGVLDRMAGLPSAANSTTPVVSYDREVARRYLQALAAGFDQPSVSAALELRNDGRVSLTPGQPGRVVNVEQALADLEAGLAQRSVSHVVELGYRQDQPAVSTSEAEAALQAVRQMIGQPIWLTHGSGGWMIEPAQLRNALVLDRIDAGYAPRIEVTRFNDVFQRIEDTLSAEPRHGAFDFDDTRDRVLDFQPGHPGQRLDRPALERSILEAVRQPGERRVEVPVILMNKEFDTFANPLGIKDLLGVGSSIYKGSPDYRDHNIAVGAAKLDGMIVRPGETFSFNERIGAFTKAEGWVEGSVIVEDRTEQGIGGGICQVSTTLFRAVLAAGLPIEERWPHLYRVRYYEMGGSPIGFDSTIFSPGIDLKFKNDFETPIMLRALIDRRLSTLDFEIWGAADGRTVRLGKPRLWDWEDPPADEGIVNSEEEPDFEEQVEYAKDGVKASVTRTVVLAGGETRTGTFLSTYEAWPNRYIVGIDEAKARFPAAFNKWVDENQDEAARWGVSKVPGVSSDPDAPAG
ncbi:MAG: VanW family protein [Chloroflexi bacterium]|nr:VanW family protein [Chloroflexota bacterium]MCY3958425.1 VanW family protein [Chloroflexota bacterium]